LAWVAQAARARGLGVMVFTGYLLQQLQASSEPGASSLLGATDLLIDGPYLHSRRSTRRRWVGSDNQRVHFLTERYRRHPDLSDRHVQSVHISLTGGDLVVSGWPGAVQPLRRQKGGAPWP
jgi:anaerobic ribonucleoside-triphosphate reductase activating protein